MSQFIIILVFIVVIVAIIKYAKKMEKERSESIERIAQNMGFQFESNPTVDYLKKYSNFQLFNSGHSKKIRNLMFIDGISTSAATEKKEIFGYQYRTGNGKHSSTYMFTIVSFRFSEHKFTDFDLRPEHIFHKIGGVFGYQDIDIDSDPEFSKIYLLQGRNEKAIRNIFTPKICEILVEQKPLCIESRDNTMIFYQQYNRLAPEEIHPFYDEARKIYDEFCNV